MVDLQKTRGGRRRPGAPERDHETQRDGIGTDEEGKARFEAALPVSKVIRQPYRCGRQISERCNRRGGLRVIRRASGRSVGSFDAEYCPSEEPAGWRGEGKESHREWVARPKTWY